MFKNIVNKLIHLIYNIASEIYGYCVQYFSIVIALQPLVIRLRITNRCNLKCGFCYLKENLNIDEDNHLTLIEWKKIIRNIPRWSIVDITGAEPFMAKNFSEVLKMLLCKKIKVSLITNGMIINKEIIKTMVEKKLFFLMLSVDGNRKTHNKLRGNKKSFEKIIEFINEVNRYKKSFNSRFPLICIKTTIMDENVDELMQLGDFFFNELKVDQQSLNLLFKNEARGGKQLQVDPQSNVYTSGNNYKYKNESIDFVISKVDEYLLYAKQNNFSVNIKPEIKKNDWRGYIKNPSFFGSKMCNKSYSIVTLYYDGEVTPCDLNFKITNIRNLNYNLANIWYEKKLKIFRKINLKKEFPPCCDACCLATQQLKEKPNNKVKY